MIKAMSSVGHALGPVIGGALYEAGGFALPFLLFGSAAVSCGLITLVIMPSLHYN